MKIEIDVSAEQVVALEKLMSDATKNVFDKSIARNQLLPLLLQIKNNRKN